MSLLEVVSLSDSSILTAGDGQGLAIFVDVTNRSKSGDGCGGASAGMFRMPIFFSDFPVCFNPIWEAMELILSLIPYS